MSRATGYAAWAGITAVGFLGVVGLAQLGSERPTTPPGPTITHTVTETRTERPEPSATHLSPETSVTGTPTASKTPSTAAPTVTATSSPTTAPPSTPSSATAPVTSTSTMAGTGTSDIPDCNGRQLQLPTCKRIEAQGTVIFSDYGQTLEIVK